LPGYDYSRSGAYFVSICTKDRKCLFGDIVKREMLLNDAGGWWTNGNGVGTATGNNITGEHTGSPLHRVIQWFKTMTTNEYIRGVKQHAWAPFPGKLWQRNYYEHIIRNENEMALIREYIMNNPAQWATDRENPFVKKPALRE